MRLLVGCLGQIFPFLIGLWMFQRLEGTILANPDGTASLPVIPWIVVAPGLQAAAIYAFTLVSLNYKHGWSPGMDSWNVWRGPLCLSAWMALLVHAFLYVGMFAFPYASLVYEPPWWADGREIEVFAITAAAAFASLLLFAGCVYPNVLALIRATQWSRAGIAVLPLVLCVACFPVTLADYQSDPGAVPVSSIVLVLVVGGINLVVGKVLLAREAKEFVEEGE